MAKLVKIEGEVMVRSQEGKATLIDLYEEEFILEGVESEAQARSIIKNGLLSERLRKNTKGYKRFRTYEVTSFEDTDKKSDSSELDKLLVEASKKGCLPDNLDNYKSAAAKTKAIQKALKVYEDRKKAKKKNSESLSGAID